MIGWIGSLLLAICAVPELIVSINTKNCSISWGMLLTWFLGEILVAIHVYRKHHDIALLTNYALNIVIIAALIYYKL